MKICAVFYLLRGGMKTILLGYLMKRRVRLSKQVHKNLYNNDGYFVCYDCEAHWGYGVTNKHAPKTCEKEDVKLINIRIATYKKQIEKL
jgi:hypothetical protein